MRTPKLTIAQKRWNEVKRLAAMKNPEPTDEDLREAEKAMNSYYRLCGLSERNLYLSNDERTCNRASTKASEDRELKWHKRLDKIFQETYGLRLKYFGYHPTISYPDNRQAISIYFYN